MSSPSPASPTLVLVPGSWHTAKHYEKLAAELQTQGFKCLPLSLPSSAPTTGPGATLDDDTALIRKTVFNELDNHNLDVIVIAHSHGGAPTNNALRALVAFPFLIFLPCANR
jgi:alpha-beta hydrolase superfamily lysophospholipase